MARTRETVRRYMNERKMRRDIEWYSRRGWRIKSTQAIPVSSTNRGCGCLFAPFGLGRSASQHVHSYIVVYERDA
jgi:hypothetical protein